jgi:methyl-accepting chemotaxis protein
MRLTSKFAVILLIPITALVASYLFSRDAIEQLAQQQVEQQAKLVMKAAMAARDYTSKEIKPLIKELTKETHSQGAGPATGSAGTGTTQKEPPSGAETRAARKEFIKPMIPAYAARRVLTSMFENDEDFEGYLYKEAAKNPTLEKDKADEDESRWIDNFSNQLTQTTTKGVKNRDGREVTYFAQRMSIDRSCLDCHGMIEDVKTPEFLAEYGNMVAAYGGEAKIGGFGWTENDLAAQVVYVPKDKPYEIARGAVSRIGLVLLLSGILMVVSLWMVVNTLVLRPVARLSEMADQISQGHLNPTGLPVRGKDEIAQLTMAFNRMNKSLYKAVKRLKGE